MFNVGECMNGNEEDELLSEKDMNWVEFISSFSQRETIELFSFFVL